MISAGMYEVIQVLLHFNGSFRRPDMWRYGYSLVSTTLWACGKHCEFSNYSFIIGIRWKDLEAEYDEPYKIIKKDQERLTIMMMMDHMTSIWLLCAGQIFSFCLSDNFDQFDRLMSSAFILRKSAYFFSGNIHFVPGKITHAESVWKLP